MGGEPYLCSSHPFTLQPTLIGGLEETLFHIPIPHPLPKSPIHLISQLLHDRKPALARARRRIWPTTLVSRLLHGRAATCPPARPHRPLLLWNLDLHPPAATYPTHRLFSRTATPPPVCSPNRTLLSSSGMWACGGHTGMAADDWRRRDFLPIAFVGMPVGEFWAGGYGYERALPVSAVSDCHP